MFYLESSSWQLYLRIDSQSDQHEEKEHRPNRGKGHLRDGFWVDDKGKTRSVHCQILHRHTLLFRHETQHGKYDETREETGQWVYRA